MGSTLVHNFEETLAINEKLPNGPYLQLCHKIKMAAIFGRLCTESLWRGYRFVVNDIKKFKNISGEAYMQSSDANDFLAGFYYSWQISIG